MSPSCSNLTEWNHSIKARPSLSRTTSCTSWPLRATCAANAVPKAPPPSTTILCGSCTITTSFGSKIRHTYTWTLTQCWAETQAGRYEQQILMDAQTRGDLKPIWNQGSLFVGASICSCTPAKNPSARETNVAWLAKRWREIEREWKNKKTNKRERMRRERDRERERERERDEKKNKKEKERGREKKTQETERKRERKYKESILFPFGLPLPEVVL